MSVLALATALKLRETRSPTAQSTQALTPSCSITFTLKDTNPRLAQNKTTPSPLIQNTPTATKLITTTPTFTLTPMPTKKPLTQTTAPTPTLSQATIPELPVSGVLLPTITIIITGSCLLISGLIRRKRR